MSNFLGTIKELIKAGEVKISEHGYDELEQDGLTIDELLSGIRNSKIVHEYPNYSKGSCILLLQNDQKGKPVHVVWGIPKGHDKPMVLVTAYRPDPNRWDNSFLKRR